MSSKWKIIARHDWVANATISESFNIKDDRIRRFTATICGWRNWKIFEGRADNPEVADFVRKKVIRIRTRIESGDNKIFDGPNKFKTKIRLNDI